MVWAKIDCDIFTDPKIAQLTEREQIAFLKLVLFCRKNLTDGIFYEHDLKIVCPKFQQKVVEKLLKSLQKVGLIKICNTDVTALQIINFTQHQTTKIQAQQAKEQARQRVEKHRNSNKNSKSNANVTPLEKSREEKSIYTSSIINQETDKTDTPKKVEDDDEKILEIQNMIANTLTKKYNPTNTQAYKTKILNQLKQQPYQQQLKNQILNNPNQTIKQHHDKWMIKNQQQPTNPNQPTPEPKYPKYHNWTQARINKESQTT